MDDPSFYTYNIAMAVGISDGLARSFRKDPRLFKSTYKGRATSRTGIDPD